MALSELKSQEVGGGSCSWPVSLGGVKGVGVEGRGEACVLGRGSVWGLEGGGRGRGGGGGDRVS